jgi:hypothetical protein
MSVTPGKTGTTRGCRDDVKYVHFPLSAVLPRWGCERYSSVRRCISYTSEAATCFCDPLLLSGWSDRPPRMAQMLILLVLRRGGRAALPFCLELVEPSGDSDVDVPRVAGEAGVVIVDGCRGDAGTASPRSSSA